MKIFPLHIRSEIYEHYPDHFNQDRVLVCRIVRSYVHGTSIVLRLYSGSFLLCLLCFSFVSSVFPLFSLFFFVCFLCYFAWFLCFPSIFSGFFLNSINNLPILLMNRVTTNVFTIFHQPINPT